MFDFDELQDDVPSEEEKSAPQSSQNPSISKTTGGYAKSPAVNMSTHLGPAGPNPLLPQYSEMEPKEYVRGIVCIGPPSVSVSDWREPQPKDLGDMGDANILLHFCNVNALKLIILEVPLGKSAEDVGQALATDVVERLGSLPWLLVGVSVGAWVAMEFLFHLRSESPKVAASLTGCVIAGLPPAHVALENLPASLPAGDAAMMKDSRKTEVLQIDRVPGYMIMCSKTGIPASSFDKGWKVYLTYDKHTFTLPSNLDFLTKDSAAKRTFFVFIANADWQYSLAMTPPKYVAAPYERYQVVAKEKGIPVTPYQTIESSNPWLKEMMASNKFVPFQKLLPGINEDGEKDYVSYDSWAAGPVFASIGVDHRYFAKVDTKPKDVKDPKGAEIVSLARFSHLACTGSEMACGETVHPGAIKTVMDETTAEVFKYFVQPNCVTRRIKHSMKSTAFPFVTYRFDTKIVASKKDGMLADVESTMFDYAGNEICKTEAEMVDMVRLQALKVQGS